MSRFLNSCEECGNIAQQVPYPVVRIPAGDGPNHRRGGNDVFDGIARRPGRLSSRSLKFSVAVTILAAALGAFATNGGGPDWEMIGHDSENNRNQPFERTIGVDNVSHPSRSGERLPRATFRRRRRL